MKHFIFLSILAIYLAYMQFSTSCVISDTSKWWPNGEIYYTFDGFSPNETEFIESCMRSIENITCVRFISATPDMTAYVQITKSNTTCGAHVGFLNTKQMVYLTSTCLIYGKTTHELLHCVGKPHEHNCPNRDDYCTVNYENIQEGKEFAFDKLDEWEAIYLGGVIHDYGSIMHYGPNVFSANGLPTLSCNGTIGQRKKLSDNDIAEVNAMYCDKTTTTTTTTTPVPTTTTSTTSTTTTSTTTTPAPTTSTTTKKPQCRLPKFLCP